MRENLRGDEGGDAGGRIEGRGEGGREDVVETRGAARGKRVRRLLQDKIGKGVEIFGGDA